MTGDQVIALTHAGIVFVASFVPVVVKYRATARRVRTLADRKKLTAWRMVALSVRLYAGGAGLVGLGSAWLAINVSQVLAIAVTAVAVYVLVIVIPRRIRSGEHRRQDTTDAE